MAISKVGSANPPVSDTLSNVDATTRRLLACGVAAGPLYLVVGFAQAFTRKGFDPAHNDLSVLANGALGWIQIANLIITGVLTLLCAAGLRRVLRGGRGQLWGPLLIGLFAIGLIGAGLFVADPMNGFPLGTPAGHTASPTLHGFLHFVTGGIGFIGFIAGALVISRRFFATGERVLGWFSVVTGVLFLLAFVGIATGSTRALIVLGFTAAVVLAWIWLAVVSVRFRKAERASPDT